MTWVKNGGEKKEKNGENADKYAPIHMGAHWGFKIRKWPHVSRGTRVTHGTYGTHGINGTNGIHVTRGIAYHMRRANVKFLICDSCHVDICDMICYNASTNARLYAQHAMLSTRATCDVCHIENS